MNSKAWRLEGPDNRLLGGQPFICGVLWWYIGEINALSVLGQVLTPADLKVSDIDMGPRHNVHFAGRHVKVHFKTWGSCERLCFVCMCVLFACALFFQMGSSNTKLSVEKDELSDKVEMSEKWSGFHLVEIHSPVWECLFSVGHVYCSCCGDTFVTAWGTPSASGSWPCCTDATGSALCSCSSSCQCLCVGAGQVIKWTKCLCITVFTV